MCGRVSNHVGVIFVLDVCSCAQKGSEHENTPIAGFRARCVWKGIEHENHPNVGGYAWKKGDTPNVVLGVCEKASNTKTTPTWVISMLSMCGRAPNMETTPT